MWVEVGRPEKGTKSFIIVFVVVEEVLLLETYNCNLCFNKIMFFEPPGMIYRFDLKATNLENFYRTKWESKVQSVISSNRVTTGEIESLIESQTVDLPAAERKVECFSSFSCSQYDWYYKW